VLSINTPKPTRGLDAFRSSSLSVICETWPASIVWIGQRRRSQRHRWHGRGPRWPSRRPVLQRPCWGLRARRSPSQRGHQRCCWAALGPIPGAAGIQPRDAQIGADGGHSYSHPSGHTRSVVTAEALAAGPYPAQAPAPACSRERAGSAAMLLVPTAVNRAATVGRRSYGRESSR